MVPRPRPVPRRSPCPRPCARSFSSSASRCFVAVLAGSKSVDWAAISCSADLKFAPRSSNVAYTRKRSLDRAWVDDLVGEQHVTVPEHRSPIGRTRDEALLLAHHHPDGIRRRPSRSVQSCRVQGGGRLRPPVPGSRVSKKIDRSRRARRNFRSGSSWSLRLHRSESAGSITTYACL